MPIHTVLGEIAPEELGRTSMHEHVLDDARVWYEPPREDPPVDASMTMENLGFVRWNLVSLEDNLILDDPDLAIRELAEVPKVGGSAIVDLTTVGLGRRVAELPRISRESGVHILCGTGFYVHGSHPVWVEDASVQKLTDFMVDELENGIEGTGIKPAIIGEIGTSEPITPREWNVVKAAGQAGAATGTAVNIHLDPRGTNALEVLRALMGEGMPADRVVLSHMDEHMDRGYHAEVAASGAVIEFDTFGSEFYFADLFKDPTDKERFEHVRYLLDLGAASRLVFGCDVWVKADLMAYGGMSYHHLLRRAVPAMKRSYGVTEADLDQILVQTPRRLLDRPATRAIAGSAADVHSQTES